MNKKIKIGLTQYSPVWENKLASGIKIKKIISDAKDFDLFVFPEMTLTGFYMQAKNLAEDFSGETFTFFSLLAKSTKTSLIYGFVEKGKKKIFNTLVHLNNQGRIISTYRKIHPFSFANEDKYFGKGKEIVITRIKGLKFGLSICYDLRFPELYRFMQKKS
jgi:predicted amidohydrolase